MADNRKALEALLGKITPLPWEHITDKDKRGQPQFMYRGLVSMVSADSGGDGYNAIVAAVGHVPAGEWRDNAAYLAAAANAVPELIADLRAAEADRDRLQTELRMVASWRADAIEEMVMAEEEARQEKRRADIAELRVAYWKALNDEHCAQLSIDFGTDTDAVDQRDRARERMRAARAKLEAEGVEP